jgi:hypothetical protein
MLQTVCLKVALSEKKKRLKKLWQRTKIRWLLEMYVIFTFFIPSTAQQQKEDFYKYITLLQVSAGKDRLQGGGY